MMLESAAKIHKLTERMKPRPRRNLTSKSCQTKALLALRNAHAVDNSANIFSYASGSGVNSYYNRRRAVIQSCAGAQTWVMNNQY